MNADHSTLNARVTTLINEFFVDEDIDADMLDARFLAVRVLEVVEGDKERAARRNKLASAKENTVINPEMGARRLRMQISNFSDRDLALLVRVALTALNDEEFSARVAEEIDVDADELETFVTQVLCAEPAVLAPMTNADLVLGMYPNGLEEDCESNDPQSP